MISITDACEQILGEDYPAQVGLNRGYLNLSHYAKTIRTKVEAICLKPVRQNSIVVALARMSRKYQDTPPLTPTINLDYIHIQKGLAEITLTKTKGLLEQINDLSKYKAEGKFFTTVMGVNQLTIIHSQNELGADLSRYNVIAKLENLAGITVGFSEKYLETPNAIHTLLTIFAASRINIIEIISTYTELTFVLAEKDTDRAVVQLQKMLRTL